MPKVGTQTPLLFGEPPPAYKEVGNNHLPPRHPKMTAKETKVNYSRNSLHTPPVDVTFALSYLFQQLRILAKFNLYRGQRGLIGSTVDPVTLCTNHNPPPRKLPRRLSNC